MLEKKKKNQNLTNNVYFSILIIIKKIKTKKKKNHSLLPLCGLTSSKAISPGGNILKILTKLKSLIYKFASGYFKIMM